MANSLIAYGNLADGATLSGGSWLSTLPRDNMLNRVLPRVARSTSLSLSATKFTADVGANNPSKVLALANINFSLSAKMRVRGSNNPDPAIATLYDSGWFDVWPAAYASLELAWEDPNFWDGRILDRDRRGYTWTAIHIFPTLITARYWLVEIDDATDNDAGFIQVGRFFQAPAWQPVTNISWGASLGWETDTEIQKAQSGTEYPNRKTPYRVARFSTDFMSESEAYGKAFDMQGRMGIDGEVLFIWDPEDKALAFRRQFLGRLRQLSPIEHPKYNVHNTGHEIKETL